ncbi:Phage integrase [Pseudomonas syringae pv. coriandricola]|uniref:Phage integrase n=2 Tax=Pseudomonas TaxID=286 RepID=A0A3M4UH19_9PSED|nr:Phage integrase [Pseudomonas syringae pv. coriandricola]RMU02711.1 Phage integrase [Pseudomonas syringae pv. coriandricola]
MNMKALSSVRSVAPLMELIPTVRDGRSQFRLLCSDLLLAAFFDNFVRGLAKERKYKTVRTYCYALRCFLNYIQALTNILGSLTPLELLEALDNYESFLTFGTLSEVEIVRKVARVVGGRNVGGSSVAVHLAAVNKFINASENFRIGFLELEARGYIESTAMSGFSLQREVSMESPQRVRQAIKANSWLAGCMAGGAKKIKRKGLRPVSRPSELAHTDEFGGDEKAFPIDKCKELIEQATSLRDKVLWSLIAATGCRISEAQTMLEADIQINIKSPELNHVLIIDPDTRRDEFIHFLSEHEINQLPHKGRASPKTFMIEPFASMFWIALAEYKTDEFAKQQRRPIPVRHPFLFRKLGSSDPMCNSYQTLYERFSKAAFEVTGRSYGFHSLRHMYGYYLVNHCPNPYPDGRQFGVDITRVKQFMGHVKISTTKKYARQDAVMLESTLCAINLAKLCGGIKTVRQAQIAHLEHEIKRLKSEIAAEAA